MTKDKILVDIEFLQSVLNAIQPVMSYGRVGSRDIEQLALQKASVGIMELLQEPVEYKHACNLWVNPQNCYEVDRCEHPPSETIKAYIRKVKAIENERSNHGKS